MSRSRPHFARRGFTLFQLLVILAFLALLFALFLPAIARARLAAARSQSLNNLKQLGISLHNVAGLTTNGDLPAGEGDNHFSASAHLLPYLEQGDFSKLI